MWKKISAITFFAALLFFAGASVWHADEEISKTERRRLAQLPAFSMEAVLDGSYMEKMETYLEDQFAGRDIFRSLKAETEVSLFGKSDTEGYYRTDDGIYQQKKDVQEKNVRWAAEHFAEIAEEYFPQADVYYAVIPDKEEYLEQEEAADSVQVEGWMASCLPEATGIPIRDTLSLEDYYRTDIHWRQEKIEDVAELLADSMQGNAGSISEQESAGSESEQESAGSESEQSNAGSISEQEHAGSESEQARGGSALEQAIATSDFLGGNAAASALVVPPETMYYITNPVIEACSVYDYEEKADTSVYSWEKLETGTDPYDFYLGGARALLTIKNPNAPADGEKLILFRDSFGSSIAPLLSGDYAKITLVDLRYVQLDYAAELLGELDYDDVLFLYSVEMLNNSGTFRF